MFAAANEVPRAKYSSLLEPLALLGLAPSRHFGGNNPHLASFFLDSVCMYCMYCGICSYPSHVARRKQVSTHTRTQTRGRNRRISLKIIDK